ncbi:outer membrane protein [Sphingomonas sp. OTU376]|uniref:outer membrane protein n=1 Tax=Sphingomonas sp. OTU376 TaxID=3043863 RepID=UPI00313DFF82
MKKCILAAAAAAALFPVIASAQTEQFSGPRAQLDLAYDQLDANGDYFDLPQHFDTAQLGATFGYDRVLARGLILGAEIGFGVPLGGRENAKLGLDTVSVKPGRELTANVRVGATVTKSTLVFATIGYSNAGLKATYTSPAGATEDRTDYGASKGGLLWGFGVEQAIGRRVFATLAFREARYGDFPYEKGVKRTQIRAGIGTRF